MKRMSPSPVEAAHAYTRSDVPWRISIAESSYGKMINYISGGGMGTFGRTVRQEESRRRQGRFLLVASLLIGLWMLFWIF